jgi:hypothetical protein
MYAFLPLTSGRIFCRKIVTDDAHGLAHRRDGILVIGVVELSMHVEPEAFHAARLNSEFYIDPAASRRPIGFVRDDYLPGAEHTSLSDILTRTRFRTDILPDSMEVFVRHTTLEHTDPAMRWAYIAGLRRDGLAAFTTEGLYAFQPGPADRSTWTLVSAETHNGVPASGLLRKTMWGPEGKYGFSHDLEPDAFSDWLKRNREWTMKADQEFGRFIREVERRIGPAPLAYTEVEQRARDLASKAIVKELVLGVTEERETAPSPR